MAYTAPNGFESPPKDETDGKINLNDPKKANDRVFRKVNTSTYEGYWDDRKTDLVFFGWQIELYDIVWGTPVLNDMRPSQIYYHEYQYLATDQTAELGENHNDTQVITDNNQWGIGGGLEFTVSATEGSKETFSTTQQLKTNFNATYSAGHSNTTTTSYSWSTKSNIFLPGGRTNILTQMVFNTQTSLPYTAKLRVRPRLRFSKGFAAYDRGEDFETNPDCPSAVRKGTSGYTEGRYYRDFDFPLVDTIIDQARSDQGDFYWQVAMSRNPEIETLLKQLTKEENYMVYVRGNWQGITGKYTVTTVTPKSTVVSLVPDP